MNLTDAQGETLALMAQGAQMHWPLGGKPMLTCRDAPELTPEEAEGLLNLGLIEWTGLTGPFTITEEGREASALGSEVGR